MKKSLTLLIAVLLISSSSLWGQTTNITISGLSQWESTGVNIAPEMAVTIEASGEWCGAPWSCYGPEGTGGIAPSAFLAPGLSSGGLVGKIGDNPPFFVGSTCSFDGQDHGTGTLYLAFNDDMSGYGDNSGTLDVSITTNDLITDLIASFSDVPLMIDGVISSAEWQNASTYDLPFLDQLGNSVNIPVYVQTDGTFLYVAAEVPFPTHNEAYFEVSIDGDHSHTINGVWTEPHIDIGYTKAGSVSPRYWFYNSYKASPGMFVTAPVGSESAFSGTSELQYEFKIVLSDLGTITDGTVGLLLHFGTNGTSSGTYFCPTLNNADAASWADLLIEAGSTPQPGDGNILVYATSEITYGYTTTNFDDDLPAVLAEEGFSATVTDRIVTPTITSSLLDGYDQLWIMSTDPYSGSGCFNSAEISAILDFRNGGKGVLIMADDGPPGHSFIGDANQISAPLGVTFSGQYNYGPYGQPFQPDFSPHPLFSGVQSIVCTENASILSVSSPAQVVATHTGTSMIAVLDDGNGRTVFDVSFARFFDGDILIGNTPQYVKNIANWLSEGGQQPPSGPVVLSTIPETGQTIDEPWTYIEFQFDRPVDMNSVLMGLQLEINGEPFLFYDLLDIELVYHNGLNYYRIRGEFVGILGPIPFTYGSSINVYLDPSMVHDLAGNYMVEAVNLNFQVGSPHLVIQNIVIKKDGHVVMPPFEVGFFHSVEMSVVNDGNASFISGNGSRYTIQEWDYCGVGDDNPRCFWDPPSTRYLAWADHGDIGNPGVSITIAPNQDRNLVINQYKFIHLLDDHLRIQLHLYDLYGQVRTTEAVIPISTTVNMAAPLTCLSTALSMFAAGLGADLGIVKDAESILKAKKYIECAGSLYSGLATAIDMEQAGAHWDPPDYDAIANDIWLFVQFMVSERKALSSCLGITSSETFLDNLVPKVSFILAEIAWLLPTVEGAGGCANTLVEATKRVNKFVIKPLKKMAADFCAEHPAICEAANPRNWPKTIFVNCPVDVYVYADNGDSITIVADTVTVNGIANSTAHCIQDLKILNLSPTQQYAIKFVGTGSGEMSVDIQFLDSGFIYHRVAFENIEVTPEYQAVLENLDDLSGGQRILVLPSDSIQDTLPTYPTLVEVYDPAAQNSSIIGNVSCNGSPLHGVYVDLYSDSGGLVQSLYTDTNGDFAFENLPPAVYVIVFVTPLGYTSHRELVQVTCESNTTYKINQMFDELDIAGQQRGVGYWKHQVNVHLSGNGDAQESLEQMSDYMNLIATHFNGNLANPVDIFEVPQPATQNDSLEALQALLSAKGNAGMNEKAKKHLTALLLNVASLKLHQTTFISEDSATASQAITYCNSAITDGDPDNDETAKDIAEMINEGQIVPAGVIDPTTANIAYKQGDKPALPTKFSVSQNYPNPFNPATEISFSLPKASDVKLEVFNIMGQKVTTLVSGHLEAGYHSVTWYGSDVSSGVYFYRIQAGDFVDTKKMVLLK